ncbi:complement component 1 Q subcomponent-binding protein, mitochondrial isoform X2 [Sitophilus oryzae]|uniref:Complement component 1 Q subcomponent-binding protein, mitochondrial isoform X2 n=1 Tax=Sitophilus oryzae TaxID=7048 RepID=A0A6J2Y8J8_SITOR|nr:complement component 1 Q subcomponent-binding protein, mitochondrial isoform X2 [Sitophilus oryzae]
MNSIFKVALRVNNLKGFINPVRCGLLTSSTQKVTTRNLWHLSNKLQVNPKTYNDFGSCNCGNVKYVHTKAEKELVEFLTEEILAERKAQKVKTIPTEIDGFKANLNGAEVTLTKKTDTETIKISFNVNHSVDSDAEPEINDSMDKPEIGELKSKPAFRIDFSRADTNISILCSFVAPNEQDDDDSFGIDEVSIYNGEWNENVYSVSGEVLDTYLYDLLLNYLEEKGISNEFVEKLSNYSTAYEHSAYIGLLEGLSKFIAGK